MKGYAMINIEPVAVEEPSRLAKFIEDRLDDLKGVKLQQEIAREAGYKNSNMITMIKFGHTKVALDRVEKLAKALECDHAILLRLAMEQFFAPETVAYMVDVFKSGNLTKNETDLVRMYRDASNNSDPAVGQTVEDCLKKSFA
jgi:tRNA(Phe) wybutosine-synthesizing methylase Tyw3